MEAYRPLLPVFLENTISQSPYEIMHGGQNPIRATDRKDAYSKQIGNLGDSLNGLLDFEHLDAPNTNAYLQEKRNELQNRFAKAISDIQRVGLGGNNANQHGQILLGLQKDINSIVNDPILQKIRDDYNTVNKHYVPYDQRIKDPDRYGGATIDNLNKDKNNVIKYFDDTLYDEARKYKIDEVSSATDVLADGLLISKNLRDTIGGLKPTERTYEEAVKGIDPIWGVNKTQKTTIKKVDPYALEQIASNYMIQEGISPDKLFTYVVRDPNTGAYKIAKRVDYLNAIIKNGGNTTVMEKDKDGKDRMVYQDSKGHRLHVEDNTNALYYMDGDKKVYANSLYGTMMYMNDNGGIYTIITRDKKGKKIRKEVPLMEGHYRPFHIVESQFTPKTPSANLIYQYIKTAVPNVEMHELGEEGKKYVEAQVAINKEALEQSHRVFNTRQQHRYNVQLANIGHVHRMEEESFKEAEPPNPYQSNALEHARNQAYGVPTATVVNDEKPHALISNESEYIDNKNRETYGKTAKDFSGSTAGLSPMAIAERNINREVARIKNPTAKDITLQKFAEILGKNGFWRSDLSNKKINTLYELFKKEGLGLSTFFQKVLSAQKNTKEGEALRKKEYPILKHVAYPLWQNELASFNNAYQAFLKKRQKQSDELLKNTYNKTFSITAPYIAFPNHESENNAKQTLSDNKDGFIVKGINENGKSIDVKDKPNIKDLNIKGISYNSDGSINIRTTSNQDKNEYIYSTNNEGVINNIENNIKSQSRPIDLKGTNPINEKPISIATSQINTGLNDFYSRNDNPHIGDITLSNTNIALYKVQVKGELSIKALYGDKEIYIPVHKTNNGYSVNSEDVKSLYNLINNKVK